jgi:hypothetical protein
VTPSAHTIFVQFVDIDLAGLHQLTPFCQKPKIKFQLEKEIFQLESADFFDTATNQQPARGTDIIDL